MSAFTPDHLATISRVSIVHSYALVCFAQSAAARAVGVALVQQKLLPAPNKLVFRLLVPVVVNVHETLPVHGYDTYPEPAVLH
jgi:hypothetical protein